MRKKVIMPKGVALWLKINTNMEIRQISQFCDLDMLTIESLNTFNTVPHNPISSFQITKEEVEKAEKDKEYIPLSSLDLSKITSLRTKRKHIPVAFKNRKSSIVLWFFKNLSKDQKKNLSIIKKIARSISSTSVFITKNFENFNKNINIPEETINPVAVGIIKETELQEILQ